MTQLVTPVQLEDCLSELNVLRPLTVLEQGKITVEAPVACNNPVGADNPALLKLIQSDKQGSLVGGRYEKYTDYYRYQDIITASNRFFGVQFATPVKKLLVYYTSYDTVEPHLHWITIPRDIIQTFTNNIWQVMNGRGDFFWFMFDYAAGMVMYVDIRGFY